MVFCDLCGSDEYVVLYPPGIAQRNQIVQCRKCRLMFAYPRQVDVDEAVTWDPEFVYRQISESEPRSTRKQSLQCSDYEQTRQLLANLHPARGRLVEVGSSLGFLSNYFREDGWHATGVEPNRGLALYANRKFGLDVRTSTLSEAAFESESVDVVLMMHVIEHVPAPSAEFREVHRILKRGGTFVVETPRYDTLMFRLLGRRERSLSCDGHIYFFTSETLARLARQTGFEVVSRRVVGRSLSLERFLFNVGVVSKSERIRRALSRISQALRLDRVSIYINLRDMERLVLRKA